MNSSENINSTISSREIQINKLFFQGGLQKFFPRDEAQIYVNNLFLDSVKFCVRDFTQAEPSNAERECVRSFLTKNFQLMNGNY